jgi:chromosome segregation ATPase
MMVQIKTTDDPNTVAGIMTAIREMLEKLVSAQAHHEEVAQNMADQCFEESEFRKNEIAEAKDASSRSNAALLKCKDSLNDAKKLLPQLKATIATYKLQLKKATEQRELEHKLYLVEKANYSEAITFLKGFIAYIKEKFQKGAIKGFEYSFEQIAEHVLKHASKLNILEKAAPVLIQMAIARAHNKYDYAPPEEATKNLKDALDKLLVSLVEDLAEIERVEAERQAAFEKFKALLEKSIEVLEKQVEAVKEQIEKMEECVNTEQAILFEAAQKLNRNADLKDSAEKMCQKFAQEFVDATKNRLAEITAVKAILDICKKRFGELPEDLVKYLDSVENGWIAYINSTAFKKFEEYQQNHLDANERGHELVTKEAIVGDEEA